jgi:hypothetical protein
MNIQWRKSSHSGMVNDNACVELARFPGSIGLRDSKRPEAGHLSLTGPVFARLADRIKRDGSR